MIWICTLPFLLQGLVMCIDEFYFHRARGLGKWESLGHPLDSLSLAIPFGLTALSTPAPGKVAAFVILAVFSCLLITKDEWIHARECAPGELWIHSVLFVLHPLVLGASAVLWWMGGPDAKNILQFQWALLLAWMFYQLIYWNLIEKKKPSLDALIG